MEHGWWTESGHLSVSSSKRFFQFLDADYLFLSVESMDTVTYCLFTVLCKSA
jgi:hypothetical protein